MNKKIPFWIVKMCNIVLLMIPFLLCWSMYYEPLTLTVNSKKVYTLVMLCFFFICYSTCQKMDCFRVSILRIQEVVFGQIIAVGITDFCMYIIIWMLSVHMPNIVPGFLAYIAQCVIGALWSLIMHKIYFATHTPLITCVIYDERVGMDRLISTYGLEKRFNVVETFHVNDVIDNISLIDDMEAVFLCGIHSKERNIILKYCVFNNIKLFMIPRIADVMMRGSEQLHMLHLPMMKNQRFKPSVEYLFFKRAFDIAASGLALIVLSPVMLAVAIAVKSDGGPALFKQKRLTKDGKVFEIFKFRSMCVDAEKYTGAVLSAGENDPRITKVGRFIRACRLDELPQLFNILKGEMSVVGPRPERPELQQVIEKEVPEFGLRLQVKAGLTGYAQVYGKYNTIFYDKLLMDLMYISNPSILEDFAIILATLKILTSKESTEGVGDEEHSLSFVR